jgi:hypothetical protein
MKLNIKIISSIATTLLIAFVVTFAYLKYSNVRASEKNILPLDSRQSITNVKPEATQQVLPTDVISDLVNKSAKTINQPGWVHVQETTVYDIDQENNGILPDGKIVPLSYVNDSWYHINSNGLVDQSLSAMKSDTGEILQTTIFTNNSLWSSSANQDTPQGPYYLGSLDYNFAADVQDVLSRLSTQPEFVNSKDSADSGISTFVVNEKYDTPLLTVDYKIPVYSVSTIASFDNTTGFLVELKRVMKFEDGSERAYFHIVLKIETGTEPPKDVLTLIEERK